MSVVQRKIAASRLARRTNPCQALIVPQVPTPAATDKMSVVQDKMPASEGWRELGG
jgi:hypothetical protein